MQGVKFHNVSTVCYRFKAPSGSAFSPGSHYTLKVICCYATKNDVTSSAISDTNLPKPARHPQQQTF
jgi:hypothetical protein